MSASNRIADMKGQVNWASASRPIKARHSAKQVAYRKADIGSQIGRGFGECWNMIETRVLGDNADHQDDLAARARSREHQ